MNIQELIKKPLSSNDIYKEFNNKIKIITYEDIFKFKNIDSLLNPHQQVFLLYQSKKDYGHWTCLYKISNIVYFFDSYGIIPDDQIKKSKYYEYLFHNKKLKKYLTSLMYHSNYKIEYNQYQLQEYGNKISTCGRWCIIRLKYKNISVDDFYNIFNNLKDILKPDVLITLLTYYI